MSWVQARGALQRALRLQHDRAVDHAAVELGSARRCGLGGEHAPRPVDGLRAGRSAAWIGATWRGWMHSLAPKPWRRDHARSASRRSSSSSCGVTPATGAGRPATREAIASGWPHRRGHRRLSVDVEVEVERVVERAEHQAATPSAPATCSTLATPRALSISASTRASGSDGPHGLHLRADSALGSITLAMRASRSSRRSSANQLDCGVVDAHDDARAVRVSGLRVTSCAIASRAVVLGRRRRRRPRGRARPRRHRWPAPWRSAPAGCPGTKR